MSQNARPPSQGTSFPLQADQPTTGASLKLFNNLDETSEIGLAQMYAHYASSTDNIRVAYEAKVSRAVFDYLNKSQFTNCSQGLCVTLANARNKVNNNLAQYGGICSTDPTIVSLPCGDANIAGDDGECAIEIKAAWRELTDEEIASGRFFTQKVIYYTGSSQSGNQRYNNAVYGLISLHIIHKTKSFPAFVFASWEQVDNYDDATDENTQDLKYINLGSPPPPNDPVTRAHAIHSQIEPINDEVHAVFTAADPATIWQYYKLIGVQATPVNGPPAATAPADDLSYYYLANIVVETNQTLQNFFGIFTGQGITPYPNVSLNGAAGSPFQMGGCQGCHGAAGQLPGGDMSVIVAEAPGNSAGPPESIDDSPAASIQSFLRRTNALPSKLGRRPHPHRSAH